MGLIMSLSAVSTSLDFDFRLLKRGNMAVCSSLCGGSVLNVLNVVTCTDFTRQTDIDQMAVTENISRRLSVS